MEYTFLNSTIPGLYKRHLCLSKVLIGKICQITSRPLSLKKFIGKYQNYIDSDNFTNSTRWSEVVDFRSNGCVFFSDCFPFICLCAFPFLFVRLRLDVTRYWCIHLSGFGFMHFLLQVGPIVNFGGKRFLNLFIDF